MPRSAATAAPTSAPLRPVSWKRKRPYTTSTAQSRASGSVKGVEAKYAMLGQATNAASATRAAAALRFISRQRRKTDQAVAMKAAVETTLPARPVRQSLSLRVSGEASRWNKGSQTLPISA